MFSRVDKQSVDYVLVLVKFNDQELASPCPIHECKFLDNQIDKKRMYWNTQLLANPEHRESALMMIKSYVNAKSSTLELFKRTSEVKTDILSSLGTQNEIIETISW